MRLSAILDPQEIKKSPVNALFVAAFLITVGFISAFFIFPAEFSISIISFSSLLILPFVIRVLETEKFVEKKNVQGIVSLFRRHERTIIFFIFIFFGMALEYTMLFGFVTPEIGNIAFEQQLGLILRSPTGYFAGSEIFWEIVTNNIRLVFICMVLSIFYGVGAIFILNYNASIVGIIYGSSIRTMIYGVTYPVFPNPLWYLPHIILEVMAYLLASIAGAVMYKSIKMNG
ncbi:MAG: stage II sporulation protein M, partial [Candidatus Aenigmatarchaeota archaeon]